MFCFVKGPSPPAPSLGSGQAPLPQGERSQEGKRDRQDERDGEAVNGFGWRQPLGTTGRWVQRAIEYNGYSGGADLTD